MCKNIIILIIYSLITFLASAEPYGNYDLKKLLTSSDTTSTKQTFNINYLDEIISDLGKHAYDYPPKFDSKQDQQRATIDAYYLSQLLDIITDTEMTKSNISILKRAALLNSLAHNLNIAHTGEKADSLYKKILVILPHDPSINYNYGTFLASANQVESALPYLKKALQAGNTDANYTLGMAYMMLGNKKEAIHYLKQFQKIYPQHKRTAELIEGIEKNKVTINICKNVEECKKNQSNQ